MIDGVLKAVFGVGKIVAKDGAKKIMRKTTDYGVKRAVKQHMRSRVVDPKMDAIHKATWTYKDKIADLKTDHGLAPDYVRDLIKNARSKDALSQIKSYLESDRNDIKGVAREKMLNDVIYKAKSIQYREHMHEQITNMPDPFAMVTHHAHNVLHQITEWMV